MTNRFNLLGAGRPHPAPRLPEILNILGEILTMSPPSVLYDTLIHLGKLAVKGSSEI